MLVLINGVDLTPYINPKTYNMNAIKKYESWEDGNWIEHRIYQRAKIQGSFDVVLYGGNNMTTSNFLETWNGAVNNEVVIIKVFVQNTNTFELIEAYFDFDGKFHREMINGEYCDKLTIKIMER